MCGLFGYSARPGVIETIDPMRFVAMNTVLALEMDGRGGDSWGHADFSNEWQPQVYKGISDMIGQVTTSLGDKPISRIAHTRKKTTGAITTRNAHPFVIGRVVGAHNGIVNNYQQVAASLGVNVEVDSEVIFHALDRHSNLDEINAYGAITYAFTDIPNKVMLGRFNGGQLTVYGVGTSQDCQMLVWASTERAVEAALEAAKLPGFKYKVEDGHLYAAENGDLFHYGAQLDFRASFTSTRSCGAGYTSGSRHDDEWWNSYWREREGIATRTSLPLLTATGAVDDETTIVDDVLTRLTNAAIAEDEANGDKKKESESADDGRRSLDELWERFYGTVDVSFEDFALASIKAQCEICLDPQWDTFDVGSSLFLCGQCQLDLECDYTECLRRDDIRQMITDYRNSMRKAHIKGDQDAIDRMGSRSVGGSPHEQ